MNTANENTLRYTGFVRFLLRRMGENRLFQVAGSLTFTSMLALVPVLTIALIVISAMPMFDDYSTRFKLMLLTKLMPEFAGRILTVYMRQFADNAARLTAVGILMLVATSLTLIATIERTFNAIWGVTRARHWLQQSLIYWCVLTLGPTVLVGGLILWHNLLRSSGLRHSAPLLEAMIQSAGAIGLTTLALSLLYRLPQRYVPRAHAYWGALLTSLLLEIARQCFSLYVGSVASYKLVYGAFASVPIVLLWVYCMWLVVLAGAVFTCALSYWPDEVWRRPLTPRRRLLDALQILRALAAARDRGTALTAAALRLQVPVGFDEMGWILDRLAERSWVRQGGDGSWILMKPLTALSMSDLVGVFIYSATPGFRREGLEASFDQLVDPLLGQLAGVTLQRFIQNAGADGLAADPIPAPDLRPAHKP